ncbi:hypothetical protein SNOG_20136 [Parastagonospora nodorum SN15]|uniref:Uncharacterized protein n=1 Tax=Phaeosphaeria nodorum (strain SN15 / ATCC MYA-4574 / FGSC 10173) TaxID=321614 RepID=A9JXD2_PHANO|nr:hypothetical protein SNOG_20136 [Parastagonospora nodorum SN15]EDP89822.1 hypothetical protein SNOG_20136 [Parastagonospora nodorum SN15]
MSSSEGVFPPPFYLHSIVRKMYVAPASLSRALELPIFVEKCRYFGHLVRLPCTGS